MAASIDGAPKQKKKKQLVSAQPIIQKRKACSDRLPFIRHVPMLSCNEPVPSVAAAPSPAPLPAFDRFIPAKGAKGRGEGQEFLQEADGQGGRRRVFRDESEYC